MNNNDYPAIYGSANTTSMKSQKYFFCALFLNLVALVIAAALSVWNQPDIAFSYAQILVLLVSLGCVIYIGAQQPQKIWYGTRAIAESVKTITWRYMMRAEPYDLGNNQAKQRLANDLHDILSENKDIFKHAIHLGNITQQVTSFMNIF